MHRPVAVEGQEPHPMQIVEALEDANVLDATGASAYSLESNGRYVLYDREAAAGLQAGALRPIGPLGLTLPVYRGEPLAAQRLLLPFIGRGGDAIAAGSCVASLVERYPHVRVDVACTPAAREVLGLFPSYGEVLAHPVKAEQLDRYDFHMSFEDIELVPEGDRRSCADVFGVCLRTPRPTHPPRLEIPEKAAALLHKDAGRPRVAMHIGQPHSPRTYPADLLRELANCFLREGWDVDLIGADVRGTVEGAHFPARVHDLVDATPAVSDLATVLGGMTAVVTNDSFPMHLAGALGVPSLAIFTSTDAVLAGDYPSVCGVQSGAPCSPCRVAEGDCPAGHGMCIAHRDPSLSPPRIVERLVSMCEPIRPVSASS